MRYHPDDGPEIPPRDVTAHISRNGLLWSANVDLRHDLDDCSADFAGIEIADWDDLADWLQSIGYSQLAERARMESEGRVRVWVEIDSIKVVELARTGEHKCEPTEREFIDEAVEMSR